MDLKTNHKIDPNFQMSSLTDIIFLLLIFFLLTSSLVAVNALKLTLPSSTSSATVNPAASISIGGDQQYYFGTDKIKFNELKPLLEENVKDAENPTVVLNAEESVPVKEIVKVFDIAKSLNIEIVLATSPIQ